MGACVQGINSNKIINLEVTLEEAIQPENQIYTGHSSFFSSNINNSKVHDNLKMTRKCPIFRKIVSRKLKSTVN